jgi:hypothetical protein
MASSTENLKQRRKPMTQEEEDEFLEQLLAPREGEETDSSDDELPYGGRAYLARKQKGDSWACIALQVGHKQTKQSCLKNNKNLNVYFF